MAKDFSEYNCTAKEHNPCSDHLKNIIDHCKDIGIKCKLVKCPSVIREKYSCVKCDDCELQVLVACLKHDEYGKRGKHLFGKTDSHSGEKHDEEECGIRARKSFFERVIEKCSKHEKDSCHKWNEGKFVPKSLDKCLSGIREKHSSGKCNDCEIQVPIARSKHGVNECGLERVMPKDVSEYDCTDKEQNPCAGHLKNIIDHCKNIGIKCKLIKCPSKIREKYSCDKCDDCEIQVLVACSKHDEYGKREKQSYGKPDSDLCEKRDKEECGIHERKSFFKRVKDKCSKYEKDSCDKWNEDKVVPKSLDKCLSGIREKHSKCKSSYTNQHAQNEYGKRDTHSFDKRDKNKCGKRDEDRFDKRDSGMCERKLFSKRDKDVYSKSSECGICEKISCSKRAKDDFGKRSECGIRETKSCSKRDKDDFGKRSECRIRETKSCSKRDKDDFGEREKEQGARRGKCEVAEKPAWIRYEKHTCGKREKDKSRKYEKEKYQCGKHEKYGIKEKDSCDRREKYSSHKFEKDDMNECDKQEKCPFCDVKSINHSPRKCDLEDVSSEEELVECPCRQILLQLCQDLDDDLCGSGEEEEEC